MHREQRERTQERLDQAGLKRALFADPNSIKWLAGFNPPIQLGANLFAGGPPLIWYADGHFTLIVVDGQAGSAAGFDTEPNCTLRTYEGYTIQQPIATASKLVTVLREVVQANVATGPIGVESRHFPLYLQHGIDDLFPATTTWQPIEDWLVPLRMVKTQEELANLRDNFALTDLGHRVARRTIQPGLREIDVWTEIHAAIEREAGQRVPLGNDCTVGYRQNNIGGWPADLEIRPQDSLIVDLSTVQHGYWSDSCATYYATRPNEEQAAAHRMIEEALAFAISLLRPGAVARTIDRQVRGFIEERGYPVYPHHTGHGVGVTGHEEPRIVPYSEVALAPGMVILLEPGTYFPGQWGVRLEDAVLVTEEGAELLTGHDKSLP